MKARDELWIGLGHDFDRKTSRPGINDNTVWFLNITYTVCSTTCNEHITKIDNLPSKSSDER